MITNSIYYDNILVCSLVLCGEKGVQHLLLEDESLIQLSLSKRRGGIHYNKFKIKCKSCGSLSAIKFPTRSHLFGKDYECPSCIKSGVKNPFFGKHHTDTTKNLIREDHRGKYDGDKNPFFGKTHTEETRKLLSNKLKGKLVGDKNPFFGKTHTKETKDILKQHSYNMWINMTKDEQKERIQQLRGGQERVRKETPDQYRESKVRANMASRSSQKSYIMNGLEKMVNDYLIEVGINISYSIILHKYQYDFGCRDRRMLLEIQGDYWHGNTNLPRFKDGVGLNEIQKNKKAIDEAKKDFAESHDLKLFVVWEDDIRKNIELALRDFVSYYWEHNNVKEL